MDLLEIYLMLQLAHHIVHKKQNYCTDKLSQRHFTEIDISVQAERKLMYFQYFFGLNPFFRSIYLEHISFELFIHVEQALRLLLMGFNM